ncbi:MAG: hypothetical protein U0840_07940 [Gemmataceae bacterium]
MTMPEAAFLSRWMSRNALVVALLGLGCLVGGWGWLVSSRDARKANALARALEVRVASVEEELERLLASHADSFKTEGESASCEALQRRQGELESLVRSDPRPATLKALACVLDLLAEQQQRQGATTDALATGRRAQERWGELVALHRSGPHLLGLVGSALRLAEWNPEAPTRLEEIEQVLAEAGALGGQGPALRRAEARLHRLRARGTDLPTEAARHHRQTISSLEAVVRGDRARGEDVSLWIEAHQALLTQALEQGNTRHVEQLLECALPIVERSVQLDALHQGHARRLVSWYLVGMRLRTAPTDQIRLASRAIDTARTMPITDELRGLVLEAHRGKAQALEQLGRPAEAAREHEEALALLSSGEEAKRWLHYRGRARCARALGRYREAAQDHERAASLASAEDRWRDLLDAAEAHALAGEVARARRLALRLELAPGIGGLESLLQLERIYHLHTERLGADFTLRRSNDERILLLLSRALGMVPIDQAAARRPLHERRARVLARLRRWEAAVEDWAQVVRLETSEADVQRRAWNRHELAVLCCNADQPGRAVEALRGLGKPSAQPERLIFSLTEVWARLAGCDALPVPQRELAAEQALAHLAEATRRGIPLSPAFLATIDRASLFAPVRGRDGFAVWRASADR